MKIKLILEMNKKAMEVFLGPTTRELNNWLHRSEFQTWLKDQIKLGEFREELNHIYSFNI